MIEVPAQRKLLEPRSAAMTRFEWNARLCFINNNALVVDRNVPSLACEWWWIRLSPLQLWRQWLCVILLIGPV